MANPYNTSLAYSNEYLASDQHDVKQVWNSCMVILEQLLEAKQIDTWIRPIVPLRLEGKMITIGVPTLFFAERIEETFAIAVSKALSDVLGAGARLRYEVNVDSTAADSSAARMSVTSNEIKGQSIQNMDDERLAHLGAACHLVPNYTFDRFVGSVSNDTARTLAMRLCDIHGDSAINPFFIYGAPGVGKTHLINAIGWQILRKNPQLKVLYISADNFIQQFTSASCNHKTAEFTKFYRNVDILLIDDIQSLIGKSKTQTVFFQIFNHLYLLGKQIIFTCDKPPSELHGMEERLLSRIAGSCITYIERPDEALRREILYRKMEENGVTLSEDIIDFIVKSVTTSLRELEGALNTLMVNSLVCKREITLRFAQEMLRQIIKKDRCEVTSDIIIKEISAHLHVSIDDIKSNSRKQELVQARQIIMYMLKKHTDESYAAIGMMLGKRTHTTVVHGCQTIQEQLKINPLIKDTINSVERKLML